MMLNAHRMEREGRDDRILLAIYDVVEREDARRKIEDQKEYIEKIFDASREALLILGRDLHVRHSNETFYESFRVDPSETEARLVYEFGNGQRDIPKLRELLEDVLPENNAFDNFEVDHEFDDIGRRTMVLNARRVADASSTRDLRVRQCYNAAPGAPISMPGRARASSVLIRRVSFESVGSP